jgi:hypothetical protein|tara:strand:- start:116 stop:286 length:171 start_codon:yes stop_codon:yes gene_type:complete
MVVTAPVFHFDKSELNTCAEANTAKDRVPQQKKEQPRTTHNKNKSTVPKQKNKQNV